MGTVGPKKSSSVKLGVAWGQHSAPFGASCCVIVTGHGQHFAE